MPAALPTSMASSSSTKVGTPPDWKVSAICTTSLRAARRRAWIGLQVEPGLAGVAPAAGVVAHVGRAAEAGKAACGDGRGIGVAVDLQRRADEHVDRVLPGQLAQHAVGAQRAVRAGEEHVRARLDVALHADLAAEAVDAFDPSAFDGGNERRVRVERPVPADLALEAERFRIGREQQLDGGGVEPDAVVERQHPVALVDAANGEHGHEDVLFGYQARITGEERLDGRRPVRLHHEVDPVSRNVDARQSYRRSRRPGR